MMKKLEKRYRIILGKKIRELRKIRNLQQIDLAYKLGYSGTGAISMIESGERGMSHDKILDAAELLGVHPCILMTDKEFSTSELRLFTDLTKLLEQSPKSSYIDTIRMILDAALQKI